MISLSYYLTFSAVLFCVGVYGVLARRNSIMILVSIELMLNAVNINLVAFSAYVGGSDLTGQIFSLFAIAVGAGEIGVGLAIILNLYRLRNTINIDQIDFLKW
ncbi:MAG: NADH-quinone oxidoreductase subunit NuoK [bacterium]